MRYTPVELRHVQPRRALFGFRQSDVHELLADVADSFEEAWRERGELGDRVEQLEKELAELQGRERLLSSTLVSAEKVAAEAKDAAKREAELIVAEAHHEARSITRTALTERERLFAEARRIETLLRAALGMMDEARLDGTEAAAAAPPEPDAWPRREDTREFELVPVAAPEAPAPRAAAEGEAKEAETADEGSSEAPGDEARPPRDFAWG